MIRRVQIPAQANREPLSVLKIIDCRATPPRHLLVHPARRKLWNRPNDTEGTGSKPYPSTFFFHMSNWFGICHEGLAQGPSVYKDWNQCWTEAGRRYRYRLCNNFKGRPYQVEGIIFKVLCVLIEFSL